MKIPRKQELLELQKKYRTDKKIGEVYGVPGRLVAYWRSKKNIGPFNQPKYPYEKIQDLWDRFGDDRAAGMELGISGPGFRQWRIKYGIKNKPPQLKMEQLELDLVDTPSKTRSVHQETLARKLIARKAGLKTVEEGGTVSIEPDMSIAVDNSGPAIEMFYREGHVKIADSSRTAVVLDFLGQSDGKASASQQKRIREFVKKQGIELFFDIGWGASYQVAVEEGLVLPGQVVVGTDDYAASYGCVGAFSFRITPPELARIWETGKAQVKVPATINVIIGGNLARGVSVVDIILRLSRDIGRFATEGRAFEFCGKAVSVMSMSQRLALTNFAVDAGATAALVPFDETTQRFLKRVTKAKFRPIKADVDARYDDEIEFDVSYLTPQVLRAGNVRSSLPIEEVAGKRIDQVMLGGCANGRIEDLETAAAILRGRRIHRGTRMFVVPASRKASIEAIEKSYLRDLMQSGCVVMSPGHGSCLCANRSMLAEGDRILTTTCKESYGDCGSVKVEVFVASPATAAATALEGAIADPRKYMS